MLLLAGVAFAEVDLDLVEEWIESEEFEQAYETLRPVRTASPAPDEKDERFWGLWGSSVRGVARNRQRKGGYAEAIDFLEAHLDTRPLVYDYADTCIWAGEEQRGLRTLKALPQPMRDDCVYAEFRLHFVRQDYTALEARAREVNWQSWIDYAREQRELRERFAYRTTRAWWVAALATIAILLACFATDRVLRRA
jgi:hypothetical protein